MKKIMKKIKATVKRKIKGNIFCANVLSEIFYNNENTIEMIKKQFPHWYNKITTEIKKDIVRCNIMYGISPYEYFLFNFPEKKKKEREAFIGESEFMDMCTNISTEQTREIFGNKYITYTKFKEFYKRECIQIEGEQDRLKFVEFAKKHSKFVVKAIAKSKGIDNYVFDLSLDNDLECIFLKIIEIGVCIVEEYIVQDKDMSKLHPESVNTIRFVTFRGNDEEQIVDLYATLRMGIGNAYIDNVSAGGAVAFVDTETGEVISKAIRRCGGKVEEYIYHPDSHELIYGGKVPRWQEAKELVHQMVNVVPEQKYVGWDLALTNNGWVMIEGNSKPSLTGIQAITQKGMRVEIEKLFNV